MARSKEGNLGRIIRDGLVIGAGGLLLGACTVRPAEDDIPLNRPLPTTNAPSPEAAHYLCEGAFYDHSAHTLTVRPITTWKPYYPAHMPIDLRPEGNTLEPHPSQVYEAGKFTYYRISDGVNLGSASPECTEMPGYQFLMVDPKGPDPERPVPTIVGADIAPHQELDLRTPRAAAESGALHQTFHVPNEQLLDAMIQDMAAGV